MLLRILMALAVILLPGTGATASAQPSELPPLRTVAQVDLSRYLGRWYEIARLPNSFQKKCLNSREQTMDNALYEAILQRAGQQGFDIGAVDTVCRF